MHRWVIGDRNIFLRIAQGWNEPIACPAQRCSFFRMEVNRRKHKWETFPFMSSAISPDILCCRCKPRLQDVSFFLLLSHLHVAWSSSHCWARAWDPSLSTINEWSLSTSIINRVEQVYSFQDVQVCTRWYCFLLYFFLPIVFIFSLAHHPTRVNWVN